MTPADPPRRRGYGQFCAISSALDIVGERWTLLIVRDLFLGPKRYTDLREGLPGIASDLLTARLRTLEAQGLVARRRLPRPAPATVYELTDRGRLLGPALGALARLGFEFLDRPDDDAVIPPERLALALYPAFRPEAAGGRSATYQLDLDGEPFVLRVSGGALDIARGTTDDADLTVSTDPVTLTRLLQDPGELDASLRSGALRFEGSRNALDDWFSMFSIAAVTADAGA